MTWKSPLSVYKLAVAQNSSPGRKEVQGETGFPAGALAIEPMNFHPDSCRECKTRVRELLFELYGVCRVDQSFPWPSHPGSYAGTLVGEILEGVKTDLGLLRGHRDFIKAPQMPPCDYYLPGVGLIVEFDERQHFTRARQVTLGRYRPEVPVGFSIPLWIDLCTKVAAEDPDPPDRDERRAWYDALRDLLPSLRGLRPTVRLYSGAFRWCSLRAHREDDVETFRLLLPDLPEDTKRR